MLLPHLACVLIFFFSGEFEQSATARTVLPEAFVIIYMLVANFMAIDYIPHLVFRVFFGCMHAFIFALKRN